MVMFTVIEVCKYVNKGLMAGAFTYGCLGLVTF